MEVKFEKWGELLVALGFVLFAIGLAGFVLSANGQFNTTVTVIISLVGTLMMFWGYKNGGLE